MTNIVIRSDEINAAATALSMAAAAHTVVLEGQVLGPGQHTFEFLGERTTVQLASFEELRPDDPTVAVVFAEGESASAGIEQILATVTPDLFVLIGGGVTAVVEALNTVDRHGIDPAAVLHVGSFIVNGTHLGVKAEKRNVLAGFLGDNPSDELVKLAQDTFPHITIGEGAVVALSSVNAFMHLPPMLLNAMNVERGDELLFYVEGFGDSVCSLLEALDKDRIALGLALGLQLTPVPELLDMSRGPQGLPGTTLREKINSFPAYQNIKLPSSFQHRYCAHELRSTFAPLSQIAEVVGVQVPTIQAVVRLGEILLQTDLSAPARSDARTFVAHLRSQRERSHKALQQPEGIATLK
ncbi:hypothetical protein Pure04_29340 [Paenarthrobacter ureafaciens]|uniref:NAD/NADP octopine/nopaline dehydrogenase family protein n=1 Tax=Paenarthrobacter ureafaciens TaxID=37931 RepID=UPI0024A3743C|nr:NAD/NADP octopine/nopaline dehydrogenase family protein [Paenarthrobacter ureafaciens]GLU68795.1 hypothetical protein Pure03_27710 [Paenarthrobacter ureafaciens]GLU73219.1 hypothetical protein Pure04_29340 [Paenarthrobacter ureafaciens]